MGRWAVAFIKRVRAEAGDCLLYSYASFLEACMFSKPPTYLWLAAYGPNDGKEHDVRIPRPWRKLAAHQFTSQGRVPGIPSRVDVSHIAAGEFFDWKPAV